MKDVLCVFYNMEDYRRITDNSKKNITDFENHFNECNDFTKKCQENSQSHPNVKSHVPIQGTTCYDSVTLWLLTYFWIEVKTLKCVDDIRKLCEVVVHEAVQAQEEGVCTDNGLVVGVVQALWW